MDVNEAFEEVGKLGSIQLAASSRGLSDCPKVWITVVSMTAGLMGDNPALDNGAWALHAMATVLAAITLGYEAGRCIGAAEVGEVISAAHSTPVS